MPSTARIRSAAFIIIVFIIISILYLYQSHADLYSKPIPTKNEVYIPKPINSNNTAPINNNNAGKPIITAEKLNSFGYCSSISFDWVDDHQDGTIIKRIDNSIQVSHLDGTTKFEISASDIKLNGSQFSFGQQLVLNQKFLMVYNNIMQTGHSGSSTRDYYLYNIEKKTTEMMSDLVSTVVAAESQLAFVSQNNLYLYRDGIIKKLTNDGNTTIRNGITNWIYREEIYGELHTIWHSKTNEVAWLKFNDGLVETIDIQYYKQQDGQYPVVEKFYYPKPGTPNPTVELWVYKNNVAEKIDIDLVDKLIVQVDWVNNNLLARVMNRVQDYQELYLISWKPKVEIQLLREEQAPDGGWFQHVRKF